ncbi:hypothetical protein GCM10027596_26160 [Nocardioides korecus]
MSRRVLTPVTPLLSLLLALAGALTLAAGPARAATPTLHVYGGDQGVFIQRAVNVDRRLPGAPADFRAFAKRTIHHLQATRTCSPSAVGLSVNRVRSDGYARGAVNQCGGYAAIWKRVSGQWREVLGTQDIWTCRDLRRWSIPSSVVAPRPACYNGSKVVTYRHA